MQEIKQLPSSKSIVHRRDPICSLFELAIIVNPCYDFIPSRFLVSPRSSSPIIERDLCCVWEKNFFILCLFCRNLSAKVVTVLPTNIFESIPTINDLMIISSVDGFLSSVHSLLPLLGYFVNKLYIFHLQYTKSPHRTSYIFSCIAIFTIAATYEVLRAARYVMLSRKHESQKRCESAECREQYNREGPPCGCPSSSNGDQPCNRCYEEPWSMDVLLSGKHILQTALHAVQTFISFCLMLIAMEYNVPIFLSMIAGQTAAFYFLTPFFHYEQLEMIGECCA
ncbi:hypothetical protein Tcan_03230 [Toxocara canis]|uniref:Copper transport protein n=1 Tax=Toxocara canis TaxID=6265 RepID=A0A0B2W1N7_TOXCA|nr:hypothetical protein Tcan_03230 [Toxocara canis]